ncbi:MAG: 6-phosphofructokinase [Deltaproteobacteria bacterium]|nr:6-phosphofructokinase [Deltaproteobacteria bacterium]
MKIAVLTGGGDCPGLNAAIRAVVRRGESYSYKIIGVREGWRGFVDQNFIPFDREKITGILPLGGTILGTSRTNPYKDSKTMEKFKTGFTASGCDVVIAIGGEDTLGVASKLSQDGYKVVGIPKTIDNDLEETDFTIGFQTAVAIAAEAIDRIHTTAESHNRVMVVEVMGRHVGWLATYAGLGAGADVILIPERPFHLDDVCGIIRKRTKNGRRFSIVVVAEGAKMVRKEGEETFLASSRKDEFGHVQLGGIGAVLAKEIEAKTGYESRVTVLGHVQRGGTPVVADRILASRFGVFAVDCIQKKNFGVMTALKGNQIVAVPLETIVGRLKTVDSELFSIAEVFFG